MDLANPLACLHTNLNQTNSATHSAPVWCQHRPISRPIREPHKIARSSPMVSYRDREMVSEHCDWLPGGEIVPAPPMRMEGPGAKRGINFQLIVV